MVLFVCKRFPGSNPLLRVVFARQKCRHMCKWGSNHQPHTDAFQLRPRHYCQRAMQIAAAVLTRRPWCLLAGPPKTVCARTVKLVDACPSFLSEIACTAEGVSATAQVAPLLAHASLAKDAHSADTCCHFTGKQSRSVASRQSLIGAPDCKTAQCGATIYCKLISNSVYDSC